MNPTANQIFDLLLGTVPGTNGATAGRSLDGESGELFNELLAGLLGDGGDVLAQLSGPNDSRANLNSVGTINRGTGKPDDLSAFVEQIADRYGPAKELFNHAMRAGLPISEKTLTRLGELEAGTYSIIEANTTDGQLILSLEGDAGEQIRLTLPADAFAESKIFDSTANGRAALMQSMGDKVDLNRLFDKLHLKELVIEKIDTDAAKDAAALKNQANSIRLVTEDKTGELVLRSRMDIQNTPVVIEKAAAQPFSGELQPKDFLNPRSTNSSKVVESILSGRQGADEFMKITPVDQTEQSFLRNENNENFDRVLNTNTASHGQLKASVQTEIKNAQVARFTLPDDFNQMLRPNGRTLTLQIEPDHLGKAKIHLAMKHDALTARLVVDSQVARQAVEAGMDRLIDQLQKAHINVDSIDVSVGGNGGENGQLTQHRFFNDRPRMALNNTIDNETLESAAMVAAAHQLYGGGMIGRSGVNVLA